MSTSHNKYDAIENLIFSEGLKIQTVKFSPHLEKLLIRLNNDLVLVAPVKSYKGLRNANSMSLMNFKLIADGTGIHWPELDEDLSLKGFLKEYLRQKVNTHKKLVIA